MHGGGRIDGGDLYQAVIGFLNDDIAGQHQADPVFQQQRVMGQGGVAGAEDEVRAELDADPCLQRLADVDLPDDAKALMGECGLDLDDGVVEQRAECL